MTGTPIIEWFQGVKSAQRRRKVRFWGRNCVIQPLLISTVFGDGGQLIAIAPLATRPRRYLVRVDNRQVFDTAAWFDLLQNIRDAVEDDFGPSEWEDDRGRQRQSGWPSPSWDYGCSWWTIAHFADLTPKDES